MGLFDEKQGKGISITKDNQLVTTSVIQSEMAFVSKKNSEAYTLYSKRNFAAATTDEEIFFLKYTGSKLLKIKSLTVSSNSADAKVEVFWDSAYTSGGYAMSIDDGIHNQDRSSGNSLDVIAYHGGTTLVVSSTPAKEVLDIRLSKCTFEKDFEGVTLSKNGTMSIKGEVGVIAEKIRCMVEVYEVDK